MSRRAFVAIGGNVSDEELERIEHYMVNPVESRLASLEKPESLDMKADVPADVARVTGFISWDDAEMDAFYGKMGFAMSREDLFFCRDYFRDDERRDPTVTELRVIDTYWSDHCRHTTFSTRPDGDRRGPRPALRRHRGGRAPLLRRAPRGVRARRIAPFPSWIWP